MIEQQEEKAPVHIVGTKPSSGIKTAFRQGRAPGQSLKGSGSRKVTGAFNKERSK